MAAVRIEFVIVSMACREVFPLNFNLITKPRNLRRTRVTLTYRIGEYRWSRTQVMLLTLFSLKPEQVFSFLIKSDTGITWPVINRRGIMGWKSHFLN